MDNEKKINKITENIRKQLFELQDKKYKEFQSNLTPTINADSIIGVRTPALRSLSKKIVKETSFLELEIFLNDLPHKYYEENQLHFFIIAGIKDYEECLKWVKKFLPYVDNWAVCDQSTPAVFKKKPEKILPEVKTWMASKHTYTKRFGIKILMSLFLDENFKPEYLEMVATIRSEEYYVNMMIAWYFATALAKQYKATAPYIENRRLDRWCHNKAIQKSLESYRVSEEHKAYLKTLRWKA